MLTEFFIKVNDQLTDFIFTYIFDDNGKLYKAEKDDVNIPNHWGETLIELRKITTTIDLDLIPAIKILNSIDDISFLKIKFVDDFEDIFMLLDGRVSNSTYKESYSNMKKNEYYRRLTAIFELHETLRDLKSIILESENKIKSKGNFSLDENKNVSNPLKLNYENTDKTQILKLIYNQLNPNLIDCSYSLFEKHFTDNDTIKITWKGTEPQIKYLFKWLCDNSIILESEVNKIITNHFLNKKGDSFRTKQLSTATSKVHFDQLKLIPEITEKIKKLVLTFN